MLTNFSIESIMSSDRVARLESQPKLATTTSTTNSLKSDMITSHKPQSAPVKTLASSPIGTLEQQQQQQRKSSKKHRPKNFQCPVCQTAFSNNGQLKNHVRIHTGERPFQCNFPTCNKTFTRNEELTRHKLIHTGVRPHSCNNCGKKFGRKDHLKKHVRTHEKLKSSRSNKRTIILHHSTASTLDGPQRGSALPTLSCDESLAKRLANQHPTMCVGDTQQANLQQAYASATSSPQFSQPDITTHPSQLAKFIYEQTQFNQTTPNKVSISPEMLLNQTKSAGSKAGLTGLPLHPQLSVANPNQPTLNLPTTQIQQMNQNYWAKWYNLIGFYQQQSSVVERLGRSLWK